MYCPTWVEAAETKLYVLGLVASESPRYEIGGSLFAVALRARLEAEASAFEKVAPVLAVPRHVRVKDFGKRRRDSRRVGVVRFEVVRERAFDLEVTRGRSVREDEAMEGARAAEALRVETRLDLGESGEGEDGGRRRATVVGRGAGRVAVEAGTTGEVRAGGEVGDNIRLKRSV